MCSTLNISSVVGCSPYFNFVVAVALLNFWPEQMNPIHYETLDSRSICSNMRCSPSRIFDCPSD
ncbi:hypothetical protein BJX65DRAFT_279449 [Aspergillus insuetus]